jgi:hypothetical protein
MEENLEALSEVTSRGADITSFLKFMDVRVARWDALWEENTKPRWARLRMNLYCGKQRAVANFFSEFRAMKEDESHRLVVAYGARRWKTQKGLRQLRRHERTRNTHGVSLQYLWMSSERPIRTMD